MMHAARAVAGKEFRHMLHDRFTLALVFGLPLFQLLLFGYALETRIHDVPAALINLDPHSEGRVLERKIANSPLFSIKPGYRTEADVLAGLRAGRIRAGVEIPADYTASLLYRGKTTVRVWLDGTEAGTPATLLTALDGLALDQSLHSLLRARLPVQSMGEIEIRPRILFNADGRTATFLVPGLVAILVQMITTLLLALSVAKERELGTLDQMLVTPLGPSGIIAGKCLACSAVGLVEALGLLLAMRFVFGVHVQAPLALLLSVLPLLIIGPAGIGLLIAAHARHQSQALQLTYLIFLPSVLLSGFLFARDFMPAPMWWISTPLPTTYNVDLLRAIVIRGAGFGEVARNLAIAAVLGGLLFAAGWRGAVRSLRPKS